MLDVYFSGASFGRFHIIHREKKLLSWRERVGGDVNTSAVFHLLSEDVIIQQFIEEPWWGGCTRTIFQLSTGPLNFLGYRDSRHRKRSADRSGILRDWEMLRVPGYLFPPLVYPMALFWTTAIFPLYFHIAILWLYCLATEAPVILYVYESDDLNGPYEWIIWMNWMNI